MIGSGAPSPPNGGPPHARHGGHDPHQWLEDVHGERALGWVRARNAESLGALQARPGYRALHDELLEVFVSDQRIPAPALRFGRVWNFWQDGEHPRGLWRHSDEASFLAGAPQWRVVLDLDALAAAEGENWVWKGASFNASGSRCLLALSRGGADAVVLREFDVSTARLVAGGFELPEAKGGAAWEDDDTLLVCTDFGAGSLTASGYPRSVRRWRRGTPVGDAAPVLEVPADEVGVWAHVVRRPEGDLTVLTERLDFHTTAWHVLADGRPVRLALPGSAELEALFGEALVVRLREDWTPRGETFAAGSLLALELPALLAGRIDATVLLEADPRRTVSAVARTRDALLVTTLTDVTGRLLRLTRDGERWRQEAVDAPADGSIGAPVTDAFSPLYLFSYQSHLQPTSLYAGNGDRPPQAVMRLPAFFDTDGLAVEQLHATSADGTRVPYFVIGPRDAAGVGPQPTLLYGYGGFEIPLTPAYSPAVGRGWLARGGIHVVANIRGGGEFGPQWHRAALREHRTRAFDDFIAVAEDLVARGVTTPAQLGIMGGSNGGLLVGAAVTRRPDLFGAVVCLVPLLDMRRYHRLLAGASWMAEYGDPDEADDWAFIGDWSPYHNVDPQADYPRMLLATSTRDDRVHPAHARKFVARLMEHGKPVYYFENVEGGHAGATNPEHSARLYALIFTYLWAALAPGREQATAPAAMPLPDDTAQAPEAPPQTRDTPQARDRSADLSRTRPQGTGDSDGTAGTRLQSTGETEAPEAPPRTRNAPQARDRSADLSRTRPQGTGVPSPPAGIRLPEPPVAERRPKTLEHHGHRRDDPWYWLRDDERRDPEVLAHLQAENAYTRAMLAHTETLQQRLYEEMVARLPQEDMSVPYRLDGWLHYCRYEAGREHPIHARRRGSMEAPEEVLIDVNEHAAAHAFYDLGALAVSPDGRWLAWVEDTVSRGEWTLRVRDLERGETLDARLENVSTCLAWANDNLTLLYIEQQPDTLIPYRVCRWRRDRPTGEAATVYEESDPEFHLSLERSRSDEFIVIAAHQTVTSEVRLLDADRPDSEPRTVLARERGHEYDLEPMGGQLWIRSNWQGENFRLFAVALEQAHQRERWREVVAHRTDVLLNDFLVFRRHLALEERDDGMLKLRILPLDEDGRPGIGEGFRVDGDEPAYTAELDINPVIDSHVLRYAYGSMATPDSVYDLDMRTGERKLLKRTEVPGGYDPHDYVTARVHAPARDGRRVPVTLLYRRGLRPDGTHPLWIAGYGAYGLSIDPTFSPARLSLVDRGFVFAIAHVRGGEDLGRRWYDEGRLLNKPNTFQDFIDVTEHLLDEGWGQPGRVVMTGRSAGGLLVGTVLNMRPDLYAVAIAGVPFVDIVTTMLDQTIPLTTFEYDEWGDPRDPDYYRCMLEYSPYDNVAAQDYPAIYVGTGLWDPAVQYWEPAKWVAKLRATKADGNRLLLHVDMDVGHRGQSGRFEPLRDTAREFAFAFDTLGIR